MSSLSSTHACRVPPALVPGDRRHPRQLIAAEPGLLEQLDHGDTTSDVVASPDTWDRPGWQRHAGSAGGRQRGASTTTDSARSHGRCLRCGGDRVVDAADEPPPPPPPNRVGAAVAAGGAVAPPPAPAPPPLSVVPPPSSNCTLRLLGNSVGCTCHGSLLTLANVFRPKGGSVALHPPEVAFEVGGETDLVHRAPRWSCRRPTDVTPVLPVPLDLAGSGSTACSGSGTCASCAAEERHPPPSQTRPPEARNSRSRRSFIRLSSLFQVSPVPSARSETGSPLRHGSPVREKAPSPDCPAADRPARGS